MKKSLIFYSLIISFLFPSCQKEDDNPIVPPITAENTFSCKINGDVFIPENHGGFIDQYGYQIRIFGKNSWTIILSNDKVTLYIFLKEISHTGTYEIHKSDGDQDFLYDENSAIEFRDRVNQKGYSSINSGEIEVLSFEEGKTLMLKFNKIILEENNSNDQIKLSDGKLNINKETLNKEEN